MVGDGGGAGGGPGRRHRAGVAAKGGNVILDPFQRI